MQRWVVATHHVKREQLAWHENALRGGYDLIQALANRLNCNNVLFVHLSFT